MDKEQLSLLSVYEDIDVNIDPQRPVDPLFEFEDSELFQVLHEIFSVDPVSGFPQGDISYYLSPEGNPQVKQWIENNLLSPRSKSTGTSIEGVTDDLIEEMSRDSGESLASYQKRLTDIFDSARKEFESLNKQ